MVTLRSKGLSLSNQGSPQPLPAVQEVREQAVPALCQEADATARGAAQVKVYREAAAPAQASGLRLQSLPAMT